MPRPRRLRSPRSTWPSRRGPTACAAGTSTRSPSRAARARGRGPSTRGSSSCCTSTARSSTTAPRSRCSVTSTPTATTERRAAMAHVPPVADERESLIAYVDQQRDAFFSVSFGLTEEQIRLAPTAGTLSIGGLIKHVTTRERGWTERMAAAPHAPAPPDTSVAEQARAWGEDFKVTHDDTLESLLAGLAAQGEVTRSVLREADLGAPVPVPRDAPWF